MTIAGRVVVVGFSPAMAQAVERFSPASSVVFVEEPDVARKRAAGVFLQGIACCASLLTWEYQRQDAADEFYLSAAAGPVAGAPTAIIPGVEYATPFAARLAERYGLRHAGVRPAELLHDKARLRRVAAAAGVRNPISRVARSSADVQQLLTEVDGPVIVKPSRRQASVGVTRVEHAAQVEEAYAHAIRSDEGACAPDRPIESDVLVEEYVEGTEYSVELLVDDGTVVFANTTAKTLFDGPCPVEQGHVLPLQEDHVQRAALVRSTEQVLAAVGFRSGAVHCEWIERGGELFLVECAGRVPGDGITTLISLAWGLDFVASYVTMMRGRLDPGSLPSAPQQHASVWFSKAAPGVVDRIDGLEEVTTTPGVVAASALVGGPEAVVGPLESSWDRTAMVIAVGPSAARAAATAREAVANVHVRTTPDGTDGPLTPRRTRSGRGRARRA